MDILRLIGIGMILCFSCITLRNRNPEFSLLLSLAGGFLMLALVFNQLESVFDYFDNLANRLHVPTEGIVILIKCLGLSYVSKIACDTCIDCGETSTATKIEFAAKISMLVIALPIFDQLLGIITEFAV